MTSIHSPRRTPSPWPLIAAFVCLLVALSACGTGPSDATTTLLVPDSTVTEGMALDCSEWNIVMEPSNRAFATEQQAIQAAQRETTWPGATFREVAPNRWMGSQDSRAVIKVNTTKNNDGSWEWDQLNYC
jgi:hypothetical protein